MYAVQNHPKYAGRWCRSLRHRSQDGLVSIDFDPDKTFIHHQKSLYILAF